MCARALPECFVAARKKELLKYFKCIEPSKEERIQSASYSIQRLSLIHGTARHIIPEDFSTLFLVSQGKSL